MTFTFLLQRLMSFWLNVVKRSKRNFRMRSTHEEEGSYQISGKSSLEDTELYGRGTNSIVTGTVTRSIG